MTEWSKLSVWRASLTSAHNHVCAHFMVSLFLLYQFTSFLEICTYGCLTHSTLYTCVPILCFALPGTQILDFGVHKGLRFFEHYNLRISWVWPCRVGVYILWFVNWLLIASYVVSIVLQKHCFEHQSVSAFHQTPLHVPAIPFEFEHIQLWSGMISVQ